MNARAPRPVLCALLVLVSIGASAIAQSGLPDVASAKAGGALVERLDSIAGAGVREDRSVGVVAAVVKGKDMHRKEDLRAAWHVALDVLQ